jgi:parvulin-like peptidyl-prolyl isomerase
LEEENGKENHMAKRRTNTRRDNDPKLTRKYLSRGQREAQLKQRVIIGASIIGVSVVVILLLGLLYRIWVEPAQAMAEIDGQKITRQQFYDRVTYERFRLYQTITETKEQAKELLADPSSGSYFLQFFEQQLGQLQSLYSAIGPQTLEKIIDERVLEKEAEKREMTVTDEEVTEEIRRETAQKEGAIIEPDVTATAEAEVAATETAELFTPTPTFTPSPPPTDTVATEAITPTATAAATFTPAPTATPNILSDETYKDSQQTFLTELQQYVDYTEGDYRQIVRAELLREKMQELIGSEAEVETTGEQINAAHILVETEEEAQQVIERLNSGEEFAILAAELSTDQSNAQSGGDLGWFGREQMVAAFEEAAFALTEPEQLSEAIETQFGWHVMKLLEGPEERELPEAEIEQARQEAFNSYLQTAKEEANVNRYWDLDDMPRDDPFIDEIREPLPTPLPVPTPVIEEPLEPAPSESGEEAPAEEAPAEEATE